jgi:hypothetical protein
MIANATEQLVKAYLAWIKDGLSVTSIDGWDEITTPFLDRYNDHLQVYVKSGEDTVELTDDGYTIANLELIGCDLTSSRRRSIFDSILAVRGVTENAGALYCKGPIGSLPQLKHGLIQAMLAIDDMFMTTRTNVASMFLEDVTRYLKEQDIRFTPDISFSGTSGLSHAFDYVIPASKVAPERIVQTITTPGRARIESVLFA